METVVDLANPLVEPVDQVIEVFDNELRSDLPFINKLCEKIRRYRGKLLRPKLLLMTGQALGDLRREHVILAAVVEMVHVATLVHDDVLDDADMRRCHVTVNRMIGNEGAVLLGDYLISHAYHLCSSLDSLWAARRVAAVTNVICEGELMQIDNRGNLELTEEDYLAIIRRKTASLTSLCCELGASVSDTTPETVEHLRTYGMNIGMAFQIVDDLLDLTGSENETGKTVGRDVDLGNLTLPLILFLKQASQADREKMHGIISKCNGEKDGIANIQTMMEESACLKQAMNVAASYVRTAIDHLKSLPHNEAKVALIAAAEFVIDRHN